MSPSCRRENVVSRWCSSPMPSSRTCVSMTTSCSGFVGGFIGNPPMNFVGGRVRAADGGSAVEIGGVAVPVPLPSGAIGGDVVVGIRPEHIEVAASALPGAVPAEVVVLEPAGPNQLLTARVGREPLKVTVASDLALRPGQRVWLKVNPARIRLMDAVTGRAL